MKTHTEKYKIRLGLFVLIGFLLFASAVFLIGKQKNLVTPVFKLSTTFKNVGGLQAGNIIRLSGVTVGTVDEISIINDSTVRVDMMIRKSVMQFIKADSKVEIGSEGVIGDRILNIIQGSLDADIVKEGEQLASIEPIKPQAILSSLSVTAGNAEIISQQLVEILSKINKGNGTLGKLIQDTTISDVFKQTLINLKSSSEGLKEDIEATKHNILFKGYFKRKSRESEKNTKDKKKKNSIF